MNKSQSLQDVLQNLQIPADSMTSLEIKPGDNYLLLWNRHKITQEQMRKFWETISELWKVHIAVMSVEGDPREAIALFKAKDEA